MAFIPVVLVAGACQVARSQTSHISSSRAKPLPRPRKRCRRSVPVMSLEDPNTDDFEDDVDTDDVISRRVFNAGITVSGLLALINGINLFGGDEFKEDLAAPFRQALPFLFSKSGDEGAERSKLNREFATYFFEQHAVVADRIGIISREALEEEEAALLERSKHLFFPDTGPGDNLSLYDNLKMYNYKLYARVHSIAVRTSPASRLQFSRVLGKDLLTKVLAGRTLPQPVEVRRDPRNEGAISEWMMGLQIALGALVAMGWISGFSLAEFDSGMLADEGRGELTITCDDVYTISCAQLIGEEQFDEISPKVSGIILALLGSYGLSCSAEDYYLDRVYRPDAADYMPSQLVTQINFTV